MNIIRKCPKCQSSKITGSVFTEDGRYVQILDCLKCGYSNNADIGGSVEGEEFDEEDDEIE